MSFPHPLIVMLLAASPVGEFRVAVPVALAAFDMGVASTLVWTIAGNILPFFAVYALAKYWLRMVERRQGALKRLTDRVVGRTRRVFSERYRAFGLFALAIFVAAPLPFTGVWTGALAAFLFGIPARSSFAPVFFGLLIGVGIVTAASLGFLSVFHA